MEREKLLTVIVPVYNRAVIVPRTLESIARQKRIEDVDIILVDNNSTDRTHDVLTSWAASSEAARCHVEVAVEMVQSASAARNRGLSLASTPWVMFFDSDDLMLPGHIENALEGIERHAEADIIGWDVEYEIEGGATRLSPFRSKSVIYQHLLHSFMATLHYVVRRRFINTVGGWNPDLRQWDDYELGLRLLLADPVMVSHRPKTVTVKACFTPVSLTGSFYSAAPERFEAALDACEKALRDAGRTSHWIDVRRAILAADYAREGRHDLTRALRQKSLARLGRRDRLIWRLLYNKQRLFPHGTGRMASLCYSKKVTKLK